MIHEKNIDTLLAALAGVANPKTAADARHWAVLEKAGFGPEALKAAAARVGWTEAAPLFTLRPEQSLIDACMRCDGTAASRAVN